METMVEPTRQLELPLELTDIVIDHLHEDIRALRACRLVCKTWNWTARFHLSDYPMYLDDRRLTVLRVFSFRSVSIVPLLRRVSLSGNFTPENVQFWEGLPFHRLHISFDNLKTLRFHDIPWHHITSQARTSLLTPFVAVHVVNLHLSRVSADIVSYVVTHFPSLEYFFGEISSHSSTIVQPMFFGIQIPATLRVIKLACLDRVSATGAVFREFLASDNLPAIHTIALRDVKTHDYNSINSMVVGLGPALRTFICKPATFLPQSPSIDFSSNLSLHTVRLGVVIEFGGTNWIRETLSSICSPLIRTVSIIVYLPNDDFPLDRWVGWHSMDTIFARPIFSSLKIVYIHVPGISDFGRYLSPPSLPMLPRCRERGLLRFDKLDEFGHSDVLFM